MTLPANSTQILIADDHRLFNDAIAGLLRSSFHSVQQVFDGNSLLFSVQKNMPDLLLLDINLPKLNGIEIASKLRKDYPDIKIIVVTMYNQAHVVESAIALNIEGYVLKDSPSQLLLEAIEKVLSGQKFFDPKLHKKVIINDDAFTNQLLLTKREREVAEKLIAGKKAETIAQEMGVGYETVKSYRKNIYLKLGVNSLAELINLMRDLE
ncbi:response regulator [Runella aurantiaca]|uniref:DNA-binding response regulator n=1 Tax=Runella aurantiaca TaxID=2282308 RepID=A0A369I807_9BACT|nr:response regulator transcription factor [Runella aurantiaca]RDB05899.1 DNA-binding response regulator [Runella aurantiaca]